MPYGYKKALFIKIIIRCGDINVLCNGIYNRNVPNHHHPNAKAGFSSSRLAFFWRFSPLRSEAEWERSGRRLDAEAALV